MRGITDFKTATQYEYSQRKGMEQSAIRNLQSEIAQGIRAENLTLTFTTPHSTTYAVCDVSLEIGPREFAGIVGPSGSGKSSLLYLISGLRTATQGRVSIDGFEYSKADAKTQLDFRRQNFGFIFQQPF